MRPKSYDYCTKTKKEATATETLFYFSEASFFFFDNLTTTTGGKI